MSDILRLSDTVHAQFLLQGNWIVVDGVDRQVEEALRWPGTLMVSVDYRDDAGKLDVTAFEYDEMVPIGTPIS